MRIFHHSQCPNNLILPLFFLFFLPNTKYESLSKIKAVCKALENALVTNCTYSLLKKVVHRRMRMQKYTHLITTYPGTFSDTHMSTKVLWSRKPRPFHRIGGGQKGIKEEEPGLTLRFFLSILFLIPFP